MSVSLGLHLGNQFGSVGLHLGPQFGSVSDTPPQQDRPHLLRVSFHSSFRLSTVFGSVSYSLLIDSVHFSTMPSRVSDPLRADSVHLLRVSFQFRIHGGHVGVK